MMDEPQVSPSAENPPVVIYAPRGRDQRLIVSLLNRCGLETIGCASYEPMIRHAEAGRGVVVVTEEALLSGGASRLCEVLDGQPAWSQLPVVVLRLARGRLDDAVQSLLRRAGVRWLKRPIAMQTLAGLVMTSVEARRRQVQVGALLREQADLNAELKRRGDQLRELTVELVEAEDRERQRIAEMLHDDLQQMLVGASFRLEAAMKQVDDTSILSAPLDRVRGLINDSQQRCRLLSHELFPTVLREGDLREVLKWLARQSESDYGLSVDLDCDERLGEVSPTARRFIYRALREMLLNAAKHAQTETVRLAARRRGETLRLELIDRGVGFDPEKIQRDGIEGGIGLFTIRERASALGGELTIDSVPGEGSRFHFSVPAHA